MEECRFLKEVIKKEAVLTGYIESTLYKCSKNDGNDLNSYMKIKEHLRNENVMPDGECPFVKLQRPLSECPCFKSSPK